MADLKNLSVEEFAAVTGSDAPAPGGGSVAALAGGLGAALAEMVANLTIGKKRYADVEDEIPINSILREFIGGCCFYRETD